jgi:hypothetical protein
MKNLHNQLLCKHFSKIQSFQNNIAPLGIIPDCYSINTLGRWPVTAGVRDTKSKFKRQMPRKNKREKEQLTNLLFFCGMHSAKLK